MNSAHKKNLPIPDLTLKNRGSEMIGKQSKNRPINRDRRSDLAALLQSQGLAFLFLKLVTFYGVYFFFYENEIGILSHIIFNKLRISSVRIWPVLKIHICSDFLISGIVVQGHTL